MLSCPSPTDSRLQPTPTHVGPPRHEQHYGPHSREMRHAYFHPGSYEGLPPSKTLCGHPSPAPPGPAPPPRPCQHRLPSRLGVRAAHLPSTAVLQRATLMPRLETATCTPAQCPPHQHTIPRLPLVHSPPNTPNIMHATPTGKQVGYQSIKNKISARQACAADQVGVEK